MQIFLFFALFISIIAILFAIQNNDTTQVSFFVWEYEGSLALVLLVAMAAGALISFLVSLPTNLKVRWTVRNQRKKLTELETNLGEINQELEETQKRLELSEKEETTPKIEPTKLPDEGITVEEIPEDGGPVEETLQEEEMEEVDTSKG